MSTEKELTELLIKAIKNDSLEEQEDFVNAFTKYCIDNNLFNTADVEDAKLGVRIIGQKIVIDSIYALNHTQLAKADAIIDRVVNSVPKLMDAAEKLKAAVKTKQNKKLKRGIKL